MTKINVQILLLLIALIWGGSIDAQNEQLRFEHLSVKNGLSQSTVFAITQDSRGFMWFGTRTGGLNKFDGNSFKVYKNDSDDPYSISGNEILSIFEDSKGRMWVGTRNFGINRFDYNSDQFYNYLNSDVANNERGYKIVTNTVEDYQGRIWTATKGGLCLYDEVNDSFIKDYEYKDERTSGLSAMCLVQDSLICFGNKKGVFLFSTDSKKIIKHFEYDKNNSNSISNNNIISLLYDSKDRLWVGTRNDGINRLSSISEDSFTRLQHDKNNNSSISNNIIRVLYEDAKGAIWACTSSGLNQLTSKESSEENPKFIHYNNERGKEKSLGQDISLAFYQDFWGNYWIGTWSGGVDYLNMNNKAFHHYKFNKNKLFGLRDNNVSSFTENNQGIWVATDGGGMSLFDKNTGTFLKHMSSTDSIKIIENDKIRDLYADKDNSLWIGGFGGLTYYNPANGESSTYYQGYVVNYISQGINNELWVGTSKGLFKHDKVTHSSTKYSKSNSDTSSLSDNNINVTYIDQDKNIWVGTKKGLHLYNRSSDNFIRFQYSATNTSSLSNDNVIAINSDNMGNVWIGTYNGLNRYNTEDQSFTRFNEKDGLPDNVVNGIVSDSDENLWISTNKGLAKISLESLNESKKLMVRHYT